MHADRNDSTATAAARRDAVRRLFSDLPDRDEDLIEVIRLMVEEFERVAFEVGARNDRDGGNA